MQVIYALIDPRDMKEFYVGRTEDLYRRYKQHLNCEGRNDAKNSRIKELQSLYLVPLIKTLEVVSDAVLAAQREAYWIRHFRYLGHSLSNDTIYSTPLDLEEPTDKITVVNKPTTAKGLAAKRIEKLLKRNPDLAPIDIAKKVGVSRQYASKIKALVLAEKGA